MAKAPAPAPVDLVDVDADPDPSYPIIIYDPVDDPGDSPRGQIAPPQPYPTKFRHKLTVYSINLGLPKNPLIVRVQSANGQTPQNGTSLKQQQFELVQGVFVDETDDLYYHTSKFLMEKLDQTGFAELRIRIFTQGPLQNTVPPNTHHIARGKIQVIRNYNVQFPGAANRTVYAYRSVTPTNEAMLVQVTE